MELETERLVLRELALSDAELAHRYESKPEVVRFQSNGVWTLEESPAYIERSVAQAAAEPRHVFDLAVTADGTYVGRAGLAIRDVESQQGALWWVIDPSMQGRGYATEAARALLDLGFGTLDLHRVYVDFDPRNTASRRVAEKLGMQQEAHLRESCFLKGEWVDSVILAVLRREHRLPAR